MTIETLRENVIRDAALMQRDPLHALMLVEHIVAPHIDVRLASRLVLGKRRLNCNGTPLLKDCAVY